MARMWIVVADSAKARIYGADSAAGPLTELSTRVHPESRLKDTQIASDRPGRTFDRAGEGRHAKEQEFGPKDYEAVRFADELAAALETARARGEYELLGLVAAPRFLGLLRDKLSAPARKAVRFELDKDLVGVEARELRERLPERLFS